MTNEQAALLILRNEQLQARVNDLERALKAKQQELERIPWALRSWAQLWANMRNRMHVIARRLGAQGSLPEPSYQEFKRMREEHERKYPRALRPC